MNTAISIGTLGHATRTDTPFGTAISRELVIYAETRAYWKAKMTGDPCAVARWWFRKRDLVREPRGPFPVEFRPSTSREKSRPLSR